MGGKRTKCSPKSVLIVFAVTIACGLYFAQTGNTAFERVATPAPAPMDRTEISTSAAIGEATHTNTPSKAHGEPLQIAPASLVTPIPDADWVRAFAWAQKYTVVAMLFGIAMLLHNIRTLLR